jgi:hypothetical protein
MVEADLELPAPALTARRPEETPHALGANKARQAKSSRKAVSARYLSRGLQGGQERSNPLKDTKFWSTA